MARLFSQPLHKGSAPEGAPLNAAVAGVKTPASLRMEALGIDALGMDALGIDALGIDALGIDALGLDALGTIALRAIALRIISLPMIFLSGIALALAPMMAAGQAPPTPPARFAVVLNAAHGGDDAGAALTTPAGSAEPEKTYTLELSVRLRSLLGARGFTVVTTRESDITLSPAQRDTIANHANAQACLSLHAAMTGSGVHLFISSLEPAPRVPFLPWKTAQAAWVARSIALAGTLNSALTHAGIKVTIGRTALPVIDSMTCPAVAVEVAPPQPSSSGHAASIGDDAYQAQIADAIAAALLEWRSNSPIEGQNP